MKIYQDNTIRPIFWIAQKYHNLWYTLRVTYPCFCFPVCSSFPLQCPGCEFTLSVQLWLLSVGVFLRRFPCNWMVNLEQGKWGVILFYGVSCGKKIAKVRAKMKRYSCCYSQKHGGSSEIEATTSVFHICCLNCLIAVASSEQWNFKQRKTER